ncbi:MAG: hypothetical protein Q9218_005806 [Villophora microphyllina]
MSSFQAVNAPGAYFDEQIRNNEFDPFAVMGLHADIPDLSMRGVRSHYRKVVMPHVFERQGRVASSGPRVPTWRHVNRAREELTEHGAAHFQALRIAWSATSVQVWNPFAELGSSAVQLPRKDRTLPPGYRAPDVVEVPDEDTAAGVGAAGSQPNTFAFDDDPPTPPQPSSHRDDANSPPDTPSGPHGVNDPFTPSSSRSQHPPTPSPQRLVPKGILLGSWKNSGLHANANAVYGSRDVRNRINRRIAKVSVAGTVVVGGNYDTRRTACSHEDIAYLPTFAGMSKAEVDSHIMPLLTGAAPSARNADEHSPTRQAAARRAGRGSGVGGGPVGGGPVGGVFGGAAFGFKTRGARFFVDQNGTAFSEGG